MGAASAVGMGRFAIDKAVEYVKTRQVWKTPIGAHQGISHPLAQNHIELELAKLMMQKAATLYDSGDDMGAAEAANMAKYAAAEASVRAVDQAVQSLGGNGLTKEYGIAVGADRVAAGPHRAGEPGDDPELRRPDVARPAAVVLMRRPLVRLRRPAEPAVVARLTLDSPHNRNALSDRAGRRSCTQGLRDAAADPAVRGVVLGHTGGTFCAGADLSEAGGGDPATSAVDGPGEMTAAAARDRRAARCR